MDMFNFSRSDETDQTQESEPIREIVEAAETQPRPDPQQQQPKDRRKYPPMSVYVPIEQQRIIEQIAATTGQTKHAVLQYAVRKLCKEWQQGIFPEMEIKPKFK